MGNIPVRRNNVNWWSSGNHYGNKFKTFFKNQDSKFEEIKMTESDPWTFFGQHGQKSVDDFNKKGAYTPGSRGKLPMSQLKISLDNRIDKMTVSYMMPEYFNNDIYYLRTCGNENCTNFNLNYFLRITSASKSPPPPNNVQTLQLMHSPMPWVYIRSTKNRLLYNIILKIRQPSNLNWRTQARKRIKDINKKNPAPSVKIKYVYGFLSATQTNNDDMNPDNEINMNPDDQNEDEDEDEDETKIENCNKTYIPEGNANTFEISSNYDATTKYTIPINPNEYKEPKNVQVYKENNIDTEGYNYFLFERFLESNNMIFPYKSEDSQWWKSMNLECDLLFESIEFQEINYIYKLKYDANEKIINLIDSNDPTDIENSSKEINNAHILPTNYKAGTTKLSENSGIIDANGYHINKSVEPIQLNKPLVFVKENNWCIGINVSLGYSDNTNVILGNKDTQKNIFEVKRPSDKYDYSFYFNDQPLKHVVTSENFRLTDWQTLGELKAPNEQNYLKNSDKMNSNDVSCIIFHPKNSDKIYFFIKVIYPNQLYKKEITVYETTNGKTPFNINAIGGYNNQSNTEGVTTNPMILNGIIRNLYLCPEGIQSLTDEFSKDGIQNYLNQTKVEKVQPLKYDNNSRFYRFLNKLEETPFSANSNI